MNRTTILAIDTSTSFLRLAAQFGSDRLVKSNERADRSHGQMIVRQISNILESGGVAVDEVGAVVVCVGPGSFTGLRVGIAVAKGMAVALEIPIIGVSLFEVAYRLLGDRTGDALAVIPHRRGEYFISPVGKSVDPDTVRVVMESALPELAARHRLVGLGLGDKEVSLVEPLDYDAADLAHIGADRLESGSIDSVERLEPLYFGKSQAEIKFEQRHTQG
jgi:tRNA threonylcarbamoyl adenosine modification protein YeaZ